MAILLRLRLLQILILIDSLCLYRDARAVIKLRGRLYYACAVSQNSNLSGHFAEVHVNEVSRSTSGKDTEALTTMGTLDYLVSFTVI